MTDFNSLGPEEFEHLTLELCRAAGMKNLIWRRPGSDGGRDLEAIVHILDPSGVDQVQKWNIECKKYSSSLSWPLVREKIAHAEALGADVLLLSTNSNPSPQCEDRVQEWNNRSSRPIVRVWRGYDILERLRLNPSISASFGLGSHFHMSYGCENELTSIILDITNAAISAAEFGAQTTFVFDLLSSLISLQSLRQSELKAFGEYRRPSVLMPQQPDWVTLKGDSCFYSGLIAEVIPLSARYFTASSRFVWVGCISGYRTTAPDVVS